MGFNHSAQLSLLALGGSISSLMGAIDSVKQKEASRARQEATNKWRTEYARIQEQKAQNDTKRLELRERAVQVNEKLADLQAKKTEAYINKTNADTRLKDAKAAKLEQQVKANKEKVKKAKADTKGETTIKKTPKVEAMEKVKERAEKINGTFVAPEADVIDTKIKENSKNYKEWKNWLKTKEGPEPEHHGYQSKEAYEASNTAYNVQQKYTDEKLRKREIESLTHQANHQSPDWPDESGYYYVWTDTKYGGYFAPKTEEVIRRKFETENSPDFIGPKKPEGDSLKEWMEK